jgi:hypothetical protein
MAAELVTPTDEYTGLPLAIAPKCEPLLFNPADDADYHHGWHPSNAPLFKTVAGLALRNSWMQYIEKDLHNEGPFRYHRFFAGPELPTKESDIYGRIVLACAGYVPDQVIDLSTEDPFARRATATEVKFLRMRNDIDPFGYRYLRYGYDPIRVFFQDYALQQDLTHIRSSTIDEFLCTRDIEKKLKIGKFLLWNASAQATASIRDKYVDLARRELLHPEMPKDPKPLARWKLGSEQRIKEQLIPRLEIKLAAA